MVRFGFALGIAALLGVQLAWAQSGVSVHSRQIPACTYEFAGSPSENRAPRLVRDCSGGKFDSLADHALKRGYLKDTEKGE